MPSATVISAVALTVNGGQAVEHLSLHMLLFSGSTVKSYRVMPSFPTKNLPRSFELLTLMSVADGALWVWAIAGVATSRANNNRPILFSFIISLLSKKISD